MDTNESVKEIEKEVTSKRDLTDNPTTDLNINTLTPEQTAALVASLLPLCQANLAKAVRGCYPGANAREDNVGCSTRSNDLKEDKITNPRTNVCIGKVSSRSNDASELDNHVSGKGKMPKSRKRKITGKDDAISLHPDSDIEKKIANLNRSSDENSSSSEEEFDLDTLRSEYLEEDETGPAVDKGLADLFKDFKDKGLSKDKVAQKVKENPRPENCNLETKQVNPEIWSDIIMTNDRSLDLRLQKSQKLISKATYAILKATDSLMTLKKDKGKRKEKVKTMMKNSTDALALLTTAHNQNEQLRRDLLLKRLVREQGCLGKNVPPDSKLLFGDDLSKKLTEAAGVSKLKPKKALQKYRPDHKNNYKGNNSHFPKNWEGLRKSQRGRQSGYQPQRHFKPSSTTQKKNRE